jgi:hypothetical protein
MSYFKADTYCQRTPQSLARSLTPYPTNPSTFSSYRFVYTSSTSNGSSGLARYLAAGLQKARILLDGSSQMCHAPAAFKDVEC